MNAFEEQDAARLIPQVFFLFDGRWSELRCHVELHWFTIELDTAKIKDEALDNSSGELPRINERLTGRRNRYGGVAFHIARPNGTKRAGIFEAVAHYEVESGMRILHPFPAGPFGGPTGIRTDSRWQL